MSESLNFGEYPKRRIDYIVEELGFRETPEMKALRHSVVEAIRTGSNRLRELLIEYSINGELIVDQRDREDRNRARVGLNLARALMYRDAGRVDDYREHIDDMLYDVQQLIAEGFEEFSDIMLVLEDEDDIG